MKKLFLFVTVALISFRGHSQNPIQNPILEYTFNSDDYAGDTVKDDSGNGNNGLLVGAFTKHHAIVKFKPDSIGYVKAPATAIDGLNDFSILIKAELVNYNHDSLSPVNTFFSASTPNCINCFGLNYDRANSQWELNMDGITHVFPFPPPSYLLHSPVALRVLRHSGIVSFWYHHSLMGTFNDDIPLHANSFVFGQREQCFGGCFSTNKGLHGSFGEIEIYDVDIYAKESDQFTAATSFSVYPDPLTSSATISFSALQQANATIELYDLAGRKVQTVFEGTVEAGTQDVELNRNDLAPGIYILQLRLNDEVVNKKVVVE